MTQEINNGGLTVTAHGWKDGKKILCGVGAEVPCTIASVLFEATDTSTASVEYYADGLCFSEGEFFRSSGTLLLTLAAERDALQTKLLRKRDNL